MTASLIGVAQDLRRRFVTKALTGVFENRADLGSADGVDHGIAVLTGDIARTESNHDRSDPRFQTPVLAQHRRFDENLRLPVMEHIIEIERSNRDRAGLVRLSRSRPRCEHSDRAHPGSSGRAVEDRLGETHLPTNRFRIPSFEHENID